jgi:succinate dehydrogenase/fumarate reductase flavoprotein subunit
MKHTLVSWENGEPRLDWKPVAVTKWQPQERTY